MDDAMQQRLNALMDFVGEQAKDATAFAKEQAPMVAQEIVRWHLWSNAISAAAMAIALVAMIYATHRAIRWFHKNDAWEISPVLVLPIVGIIGCSITLKGDVQATVKAATAPRLVIIDYIRGVSK